MFESNKTVVWILAAIGAFAIAAASFLLHYPCNAANAPSACMFLEGFFSPQELD